MKKYILLIITFLFLCIPLTVRAEEDFADKVGKMKKSAAIDACYTGDSSDGQYHCYRYTFIPGVHPMYNTTVWTNKTMGCGFELVNEWDYSDCKNSSLSVIYEQCKVVISESESGKTEYKYCKNITHSGYNGSPDFYDKSEKTESKIKCETMKPFHILYKATTTFAPILTILFITFDLIASIMSGDPKKFSKFRSKITRRLVALFLLLIIPILINILVNTFSRNDSIRDTSLIKCIVVGND